MKAPARKTTQIPCIDLNKIGDWEMQHILRMVFKGNITKKYHITSLVAFDYYIKIRVKNPKKKWFVITITDTAGIKLNKFKQSYPIKDKSMLVSWLRHNCPIDLEDPRVRVYKISEDGTDYDERLTRIFDRRKQPPATGDIITMTYWNLPTLKVKSVVHDIQADDSIRTIVYVENV